jgi:hypothetical protein
VTGEPPETSVFHEYPGFVPPIARFFELANTPFKVAVFKSACEAIAPFDARSSDDNLWSFPFDPCGEPRLLVAVGEDLTEVDCAIRSICWWETSLRMLHDSDESFAGERSEFDHRFDQAFAATAALLGPPLLSGSDPDDGYRHGVWRGRTGLLAVQQSNYDCQFGDDINYWITRWSGPDPQPTSPFIDWLMRPSGP